MAKNPSQVPKQNKPLLKTVELSVPIMMGAAEVKTLSIRCPKAGELRGLSMLALSQLEVDAYFDLLPRITDPVLPSEIIEQDMALPDLVSCMRVVNEFFEGK